MPWEEYCSCCGSVYEYICKGVCIKIVILLDAVVVEKPLATPTGNI
jgi:hypothetical protein